MNSYTCSYTYDSDKFLIDQITLLKIFSNQNFNKYLANRID